MHQATSAGASREERVESSEQGLYQPGQEHDACGVGFVAHIKGHKAHAIVAQGLKILENLDHRGAVGADKLMGDGAGILIQIPDEYFRAEMATHGVRHILARVLRELFLNPRDQIPLCHGSVTFPDPDKGSPGPVPFPPPLPPSPA